jgi:MFS family permease
MSVLVLMTFGVPAAAAADAVDDPREMVDGVDAHADERVGVAGGREALTMLGPIGAGCWRRRWRLAACPPLGAPRFSPPRCSSPAGRALGAFWAPGMALLSEAAECVGADQGVAFGLVNFAWALGMVAGAAGGGALAGATADAMPFALVATFCAATLVAVRQPVPPAVGTSVIG